MEPETTVRKPLQQLLENSNVNLLEAALPFVPLEMKRFLALYIKISEVTEVMHGFEDEETIAMCGLDDQNMNYEMMLQAMRMSANPKQAEKLEQIIRIMNLSKSIPAMMENAISPSSPPAQPNNNQADLMKTLAGFMQMNQGTPPSKEPTSYQKANAYQNTSPSSQTLERLMKDPRSASISPEKFRFIQSFVTSHSHQSPEEILPQMMQLNAQMQAQGLSFDKYEMELLLDILKESMTPEERQQIDMVLKMLG